MRYDRQLETAETCASLLQRVMFKLAPKYRTTDEPIDQALFDQCTRAIDSYIAARSRPETS